jgi:HEAT repeat protein
MRWLVLVALAGCAGHAAPQPALVASSARLAPPAAIDPAVPGASYLAAVAAQIEPRWTVFLEDCRLRLPAGHPLNRPALVAAFDLAVRRDGRIAVQHEVETSGNGDFDTAVADVLADAAPLPAPPDELVADDDLVHLRWQFARDRRQAGPATARVVRVELPLAGAVDGLLGRGEIARAARRVAAAPEAATGRALAAQRVMIAALGEALGSPDGAARRTAVEACGRASVDELAAAVRALLTAATDPDLRLAAIVAAAALGDRAAGPALLAALRDDLAHEPRIARARIAALVAIGRAGDAADAVRAVLAAGPSPAALAALGLVPIPAIGPRLAVWSARGDAALRGAVCAALPGAAPASAVALIARGLRDADATVRATCADAAGREDRARPDPATLRRLRELARDRDRTVRARAIAALAALAPAHPVRAVEDPAPEVRAAFAAVATDAELAVLVTDRTPEVRAAALAALGDRAGDAALRACGDPSPVVRGAAIALIADLDALARLAGDDSPEVATAALIRLTALRGRSAATSQLLDRLADAPAASPERARIALAWLLAS